MRHSIAFAFSVAYKWREFCTPSNTASILKRKERQVEVKKNGLRPLPKSERS